MGKSIKVAENDYVEIAEMARSEGRTIQGMVHRLVVLGRERRMVKGDTGGSSVAVSPVSALKSRPAESGPIRELAVVKDIEIP
jgi:D-alanine-D-alanine ligase-like ATP-grasp enzyme